jgi:hypothetical protein
MGKRQFHAISVGFLALIVLVVALLMTNSLRRSSHIVLPDPTTQSSSAGSSSSQENDAVVKIEITAKTVQDAIRTLSRPDSYLRTLTVENLWSGGSGTIQVTAAVSGGLTRTDMTQADGRVRHAITDGKKTYIWYDAGKVYYTGSAGDISADEEQHIPTYEEILRMNVSRIATADYRTFSEEDCIYVETRADEDGYVQRYWVSVGSGLLIGAEKLQDGKIIYRMTAQPTETELPDSADFTLPDGTVLK